MAVFLSSVVCEIGTGDPENLWGPVEVEVKGGKKGTSSLLFTYRVSALFYSVIHNV